MNELPYESKAQKLTNELKRIFEDETTILVVLSCVIDYEEDVDELLRFIKAGKDIDEETVSVYAAKIEDKRNS